MNLEIESPFLQKEGMISGIDHHLLIFCHVSVWCAGVELSSQTAHFANLPHG